MGREGGRDGGGGGGGDMKTLRCTRATMRLRPALWSAAGE